MLEKIDLSQKVRKKEYKAEKDELEVRLGLLQRKAVDLGIPIAVVFEGWDAAGKGTLINELILPLDPRGFTVQSTFEPTEEEALRPFLWRFWTRTPARSKIVVFDRSWYRRVLQERVDGDLSKTEVAQAFDDIQAFERQLADDGTVIIKFFLHISKKEQKKRFEKLRKSKATRWRVTKDDLKRHKHYADYLAATEDMLAETDSDYAPWTVVEAHDRRFATLKIFKTFIDTIERAIATATRRKGRKPASSQEPRTKKASVLSKIDLSKALERAEYRERLKERQEQLRELLYEIYRERLPVVIVYEGSDAAGKGGNLRRPTQELDPRGYEVIPIAAPNDIEKAHHYLWRFWMQMPKAGHMAIFDRSWYGRVLVERVEKFCSEREWRRAYREINEMEQHLANFGTVIVKFWLQIGRDEQLRRFKERERLPHKRWKITEEDWRNRKKWNQYETAVHEMLLRTSTRWAPWTIVESNCKWYARVKVLDTLVEAISERL